MSMFALLTICIVSLAQIVFGQLSIYTGACGSAIGEGIGLGPSVSQICGPVGLHCQDGNILQEPAAYGGTGVGELFANGVLPLEGITTIAGQVPILGVVRFDGPVQAKGSVSISGSCGCGCQL